MTIYVTTIRIAGTCNNDNNNNSAVNAFVRYYRLVSPIRIHSNMGFNHFKVNKTLRKRKMRFLCELDLMCSVVSQVHTMHTLNPPSVCDTVN